MEGMEKQTVEEANAIKYMQCLFESKEPIKARTRDVMIWEEDGCVNWLAFNLAMFEYFNTDEFTDEQREIIHRFKESVADLDGHPRYYDFYGNSLKNMAGTLKKFKQQEQ